MQPASCLACLSCALLVGSVQADTIRLRNGSVIEGVIAQESPDQITLAIGAGSTTLPRAAIVSIDRASAEENARLQAGWKQKYFLHREYVPAGLDGLAADFTRLGALRAEAANARRTLAELAVAERERQADQESLRTQLLQLSQQLQRSAPTTRNNVEAYNRLVASNNAMQARLALTDSERATCARKQADAQARIAAYQEAMPVFAVRFDKERSQTANQAEPVERQAFFDRVAGALAEYGQDFATASIPLASSREGLLAGAIINEHTPGRFVVDTGAARMSITEAFARRLQLDPASLPEVECVVADGRRVKGRAVTFRCVAVGEARAENVEAVILPGKPDAQADGLLGMSFLKHFSVNLDGASGRLILRQFEPNATR